MEENLGNTGSGSHSRGSQKQIVGAIILAGVIIAGAIMLKGSKPPTDYAPSANTNTQNTTSQMRPVSTNDHILGNINARIVIIEYSDLECPFCKTFHKTMQSVLESSEGDIAWVFRHYPIPQLHSKAIQEAEATECAWKQGGNDAFWKYTDRLFEITPANNRLDATELPKIAEYVGLNVASFNECLASGEFTAKVQADIKDGAEAGVTGTPSSFILVNGKVVDTIPGALPYEAVIQKLSGIK